MSFTRPTPTHLLRPSPKKNSRHTNKKLSFFHQIEILLPDRLLRYCFQYIHSHKDPHCKIILKRASPPQTQLKAITTTLAQLKQHVRYTKHRCQDKTSLLRAQTILIEHFVSKFKFQILNDRGLQQTSAAH